MMRNKTSSSLQKTYDECYLICSTAVYFEGQGNEAEALRSWRSALDQIYYHNAYRVPAGYIPRSETEKALKDSLRDMEMQCKERVDLLEALKQSREEKAEADSGAGDSTGKISKTSSRTTRHSSESDHGEKGFIGNGTIPAVNYPELSRPGPPLPQRPAMLTKNSSERAVLGSSRPSYHGSSSSNHVSSSRTITPSSSASLVPPMKKTSRSPSPEKGRTMLHTLRSGDKAGRKSSPRPPRTSTSKRDVITNQAASMAWQSLGRQNKDRLGRSLDTEADKSSTTLHESGRKDSCSDPITGSSSSSHNVRYDSKTRTLVPDTHSHPRGGSPSDILTGNADLFGSSGRSSNYPCPPTDPGQPGAVAGTMLTPSALQDLIDIPPPSPLIAESSVPRARGTPPPPPAHVRSPAKFEPVSYPTYLKEYPETSARKSKAESDIPLRRKPAVKDTADSEASKIKVRRKAVAANSSSPRHRDRFQEKDAAKNAQRVKKSRDDDTSSQSVDDDTGSSGPSTKLKRKQKVKQKESALLADPTTPTSEDSDTQTNLAKSAWEVKVQQLMKNLPKGVDEGAAKQIFNEIVVQGDEVHWDDVAGLDIAKKALKEAVVYPFLRPDLFMGLREPARGMLLFGPPGTGKTMLARAVATESRSTFFSISASSLTSKYLGESEKLVRALFSLAKALAPSIIFVDEIDSLLSSRSGGEHEATRRIKTEFLIQWSDLQRAAAGREQSEKEKERGDASRVLVLAATNLPWAIDEAARRRFVRRQYIPLPEDETRAVQLRTLLGHQKHSLKEADIQKLIGLTDGFSGSDITALAKDAAMGPLRSLGEALLHMSMDEIRPIQFIDFEASLVNIRPSVSKQGLQEFEDWAKEFGERGG
ncbi:probable SAP1-member of the AAA-protein family [Rhynchosporium agropyri]|uniref:Probable SAP1-member of the AAA-protein family n=2 Tax=Rhynchosporium TaxID=38037 RepID=A0A1E1KK06_9HELO|nr:probable SAP1-member of the AAA-protein family [Rhynchosporium agropyri]CZT08345.1 probable SAP1-member of the AAA-protein family [Rhynchosporium commune]